MNLTIFAVAYLFAASRGDSKRSGRGRQRYDPQQRRKDDGKSKGEAAVVLPTPPPPTSAGGPFPSYFSCRHTYEETLIEEIQRSFPSVEATSPYPGLVRVDGMTLGDNFYEPVYALQALPDCRILEAPGSIKSLAQAATDVPEFQEQLERAPRGSLTIHALVPGMCKGQKDPVLQRRSFLVAEAACDILQKQFPAARKREGQSEGEQWLLQILLLSPDSIAVSLAPCRFIPSFPDCVWPNPSYPFGMAQVDIETKMPSSAYRKLLEGFACWGVKPSPGDLVVDLGASPGGWTAAAVLVCQSRVIAVDRSVMDPRMMNNLLVEFVQGDAFTYEPEYPPVAWMISDIIAYPERVAELLDLWCGKGLAKNLLVTVKFQGTIPSWDALDDAIQVARKHGYKARAKHFFNNKNEVSLMVQGRDKPKAASSIATMYKIAWPKH